MAVAKTESWAMLPPPDDGRPAFGAAPQLQSLSMMLLWMVATCVKLILPVATRLLYPFSPAWNYSPKSEFVALIPSAGTGPSAMTLVSRSPIGRALSQVLALVNAVPPSSNKYAFLQDLADRMIQENRDVEDPKYNSINRAALRSGFTRTLNLLGNSLQSIHSQNHSFLGRLVRDFFSSVTLLPGPFGKILLLVGQMVLSPWSAWMSLSRWSCYDDEPAVADLENAETAEKFAKELLWIAEKLLDCSGTDEAVQLWSSASSLAELSLCASPKVQKSLVRLSALLCRGMVGDASAPQEVSPKFILVWLPLLCNATHGGDGPIFTSAEKGDVERHLERLVAALPEPQQEQILAIWLQEYARSPSDWPNLQNCYHAWCYATRKLELDMPMAVTKLP